MTTTADTDAGLGRFAADARRFAAPVGDLPALLRDVLGEAGLIGQLPAAPVRDDTITYVDGALAGDQTDALIYVAAVACATTGETETVYTTQGVAPVSRDTESYRSLLMASLELEAAAGAGRRVFVDGGLATSLIALGAMGTLTDPDVIDQTLAHLDDRHTMTTADQFIDKVVGGSIVGLPKQDTAQTYTAGWAQQHRAVLGDRIATLVRLRDRPLVDAILRPGEILAARPAVELRRIKAPQPGQDTPTWHTIGETVNRFDALLGRVRTCDGLQVCYFKPASGAQRTIKVEYRGRDEHTGAAIAALVAADCDSPRILEPYGQHRVDQSCKRAVRSHLQAVTATITDALADHPEVARHYRT